MKKVFSLFVLIFLLVGFSSAVSAQTSGEKSIEEAYKDAKDGISDIPLSELKPEFGNNDNLKIELDSLNEDLIESKQFITSQILKETTKNGYKEEKIAVTVFDDVIYNDTFTIGNVTIMSDLGDDLWDGSYSVQAYSRIYFTKSYKYSTPMYKLDKVTGGWNVADQTVSLSGRKVRYGADGWGGRGQVTDKYPSGNSYTYYPPSSWNRISFAGNHTFGTTSTVTLKRGTRSEWILKHQNNL